MLNKDERPFTFSKMEGQKANITAFKSYSKVEGGTFPDVMLFQGNSGSGKTTSARIIGATINCKHPVLNAEGYYEPCGECASCKSIKRDIWDQDIYFFDASAMGPDDVTRLEKYATMAPWHQGRKTVIIIDEFQELSKKSKGSTLVLLEKKRKDTVIILCTMDPKIDKSISSRAIPFTFKPLTATQIETCLIDVLENIDPEEKLPFDTEALMLLGENSWGSARQAIVYLERCIASKLYTVAEIEKELSFLSEEKTYTILEKLLAKDATFYNDLGDIKLSDFYRYAWTVLGSVEKNVVVEADDSWKHKSAKRIVDNPNYESLMQAFLEMEKLGYFMDYKFNYFIGHYLNSKDNRIQEYTMDKAITIIPPPVRRRAVAK